MDREVIKTIGWINYVLAEYRGRLSEEELETLRLARTILKRTL